MTLSFAGALVCAALLLIGHFWGSAIVIGLFASLAFGATAIGSLPSLGGSSPQLFVVFAGLLTLSILIRSGGLHAMGEVLNSHWMAWVAVLLGVYAAAGAVILPRLLAGETMVFIPVFGEIVERPLQPVSGNITQTAYFLIGIIVLFASSVFASDRRNVPIIRRGFYAFCIAHALLGVVDLVAKYAGLGDVLAPIRTANYAMLTDVGVGGFARLTGGFSEASAFAATSAACLCFAFTSWRQTQSKLALALSIVLVTLLVLSTSTTAYVILGLLSVAFLLSTMMAFVRNVLDRQSLAVWAAASIVAAGVGLALFAEAKFVEPLSAMLNTMIFEKHASASGLERAYWNTRSFQSLFETHLLGTGLGSSRSSSWAVSVLAQLGLFGALMMLSLVGFLLLGAHGRPPAALAPEYAVVVGARAAALGSLLGASISGSGADPGLIFFLALGVDLAYRRRLHALRSPRIAMWSGRDGALRGL